MRWANYEYKTIKHKMKFLVNWNKVGAVNWSWILRNQFTAKLLLIYLEGNLTLIKFTSYPYLFLYVFSDAPLILNVAEKLQRGTFKTLTTGSPLYLVRLVKCIVLDNFAIIKIISLPYVRLTGWLFRGVFGAYERPAAEWITSRSADWGAGHGALWRHALYGIMHRYRTDCWIWQGWRDGAWRNSTGIRSAGIKWNQRDLHKVASSILKQKEIFLLTKHRSVVS